MKKIMYVEGMVCNNCVSHVTEALLEIEGVAGAEDCNCDAGKGNR